jgi:hypothetical protein
MQNAEWKRREVGSRDEREEETEGSRRGLRQGKQPLTAVPLASTPLTAATLASTPYNGRYAPSSAYNGSYAPARE